VLRNVPKFSEPDFDFTPFLKRANKSFRRTFITLVAAQIGCLFFTVAGVTLVILGCLKLFGVI